MAIFCGVDVAQVQDHTVIITIDEAQGGLVTGVHQLPTGLSWETLASMVNTAIQDSSVTTVDSTGCGSPFISMLKSPGIILPFQFTENSKQRLIEGVIEAVQTQTIRLDRNVPGTEILVEELGRFSGTPTRRGWRYSGKANGKDDAVCALGLAVYSRAMATREIHTNHV